MTDSMVAESAVPGGERARRDPLRFLLALMHRRGDVAQYRSGSERAFLVNDPDHIKHVLADNHHNYSKATNVNGVFKRAVADGLLTSEGEEWRWQRRLVRPAFHRDRLARIGDGVVEATEAMLSRWEPAAEEGRVLDIADEMGMLTLGITTRALFGWDLGEHLESVGRRIGDALEMLMASDREEFAESDRVISGLVFEHVEQRRNGGEPGDDLLGMLLEAVHDDTGEPLSDREIRNQVVTLLLAGYETTANSLAWTWYLLGENPGPLATMRRELAAVAGGRPPAMDRLKLLPYTRHVLEESMRLYPPAWILGRRALGEDRLGERVIPAGSVIALSPFTMHRHAAHWDRPEEFDPDRFLPENSIGRKPFAYYPFGGGPRLCIGHNFAMIEAQIIVATVAQRFDLKIIPGRTVEPERLFVLRPRGGLPMTVRHLSPAA